MRVTLAEIAAIKTAAVEAFGPDAVVRVFGSRLRDDLHGGDIDLHVEASCGDPERACELRFRSALAWALDGEPVDVVVRRNDAPLRWIDRAALREGRIL